MQWRRALRALAVWSVGPPLVIAAAVGGTALALLYSPPGRALSARAATEWLSGQFAGTLSFGSFRGSLLRHVELRDVAISDSTGAPVLSAERIDARYLLPELLAGRIIIRELTVDRPVISLKRLRRERWNYQEVFRSGHGEGGVSPRVELRNVTITDGHISVETPTGDSVPKPPISRNGAIPAQPELAVGSDGLVRIYRASGLDARLPLIRVSTPADDPILVEIASLRARLAEPALDIVALEGEVVTKGDSLRFDLDRAELPVTRVRGSGAVRWPQDTIQYDFALDADTVSLVELHWIQPDFPDWSGSGSVRALSAGNRHTDFALGNLVLGDANSRVNGDLVAMLDVERGFGVRDLAVTMRNVPLAVMRPYLDTLPLDGILDGRLQADGYSDLLRLSGDVDFADAQVVGMPRSSMRFEGSVAFGNVDGAVFRNFVLREALVDMATVQAQVPAVTLPGELRLVGSLDGPWQNVSFRGTAEHTAPNDALSRLMGTVRLDTRGDVLGLGMDARFDQLSFEGLRTGYPGITMRGGVGGEVKVEGPLDHLLVEADLTGDIGDVTARGVIGVVDQGYRFDSLLVTMRRFDFEAFSGQGVSTAINGDVLLTGAIDSGAAPIGSAQLDLGQSRLAGLTLNGVQGRVGSDGRLMTFDQLAADWSGGELLARGTLGWTSADSGSMRLEARGFSLAPFDSLARASLALDDSLTYQPLTGTGQFAFAIEGSLDRLAIDGTASADSVSIDDWTIATLSARISADSLPTGEFRMVAELDSLGKGTRFGTDIEFELGLVGDSTAVDFSGRLDQSRLAVTGWRSRAGGVDRFGLDRMLVELPRQQWELLSPTTAAMTDRLITLEDTLTLTTTDGSGLVAVSGDVPGMGPGGMEISVVGLQLADLYAVLGRDTAAVSGLAQVDMRLGGTRNAPTLRGNLIVTAPRFRDASPPLLRGSYDYRDRVLQGNVAFWRLGEPVLEVDARLPFDLALAPREQRRLPGPIEIHAFADSADLSILEAFTTSVRSTTGAMSVDLGITGTWAAPALVGSAEVYQGRTSIPALGVRYGPIQGSASFAGDSMIVDHLTLASSEGELEVGGSVRFEDLSRANLKLSLTSRRFLAINVPGFLVVRPTGTVSLTGPLTRPVLRGTLVRITESDIYFADMIAKNVLDLEDPFYRGLVDLEEVRRERLGAAFQNRFLDSLRIESLRVIVGPDVWLRSSEAEIQLEGEAQVSKTGGRDYLVAGTLNTPRGEYTIDMRGLIRRKFTIDHGTVTYLGTPDLDANLNIQASYRVRAYDGDEIPVVAQITGSILVPEVTLTSPGRNLSQMDLVTYLMFGRLDFQLAGQGSAGSNLATQALITAMTSELERQVVQETQIGLDLFEFRPGLASGPAGQGSFTRLAAGRQIGPRWFVTINAGFCFGGQQQQAISARNFGATIEYRVTREWRLQGTAEPVQSCLSSTFSNAFNNIARRYQLGADILWQRDY